MELDIIYHEDCYSGIKKIPDNSVDLVYIDIPYLYGIGNNKIKELDAQKGNYLGNRIRKCQNELNDIINGIDYKLFDELNRVMKYIYIYMVQQRTNTRYYELLVK